MVNKYFIGSHISERKFRQIVRFFCLDIEAKKTAELTGISRQSINKIYAAIRQELLIFVQFQYNQPSVNLNLMRVILELIVFAESEVEELEVK